LKSSVKQFNARAETKENNIVIKLPPFP